MINRHGCTPNSNRQTLSNVSPAAQSFNPHPLSLFIPRPAPREGLQTKFLFSLSSLIFSDVISRFALSLGSSSSSPSFLCCCLSYFPVPSPLMVALE